MPASKSRRTLPGFTRLSRPSKALQPGTLTEYTGGNPSGFVLQDNAGNDWYVWFDTNGVMRFENAVSVETAGFNFNTGGQAGGGTFALTIPLLASSVDTDVWIAPSPMIVVAVRESHSVVGGASAAVRPRKITDTSAPGAAASGTVKEITTAALDLTASINTQRSGTLVATAADLTFAAGDRLALDFSGTLTGLVGQLTILLAGTGV